MHALGADVGLEGVERVHVLEDGHGLLHEHRAPEDVEQDVEVSAHEPRDEALARVRIDLIEEVTLAEIAHDEAHEVLLLRVRRQLLAPVHRVLPCSTRMCAPQNTIRIALRYVTFSSPVLKSTQAILQLSRIVEYL